MLSGQNWLVGITGGIAAYKTLELIRLLKQQGANVRVVLSNGASQFVTKMTLQALSGHPVYDELFDEQFEAAMGHIALAKWAHHFLIAPLSANRLAALAMGSADDLLTTISLATTAKIWVAPAMNKHMWSHPAVQANIRTVTERGATILGPEFGLQACQDVGWGRMQEPAQILSAILAGQKRSQQDNPQINKISQTMQGLKILITAGPTREYLDPIRYITNKSSGKMGYAIAEAAAQKGAKVHLISGPVRLPVPQGVQCTPVTSAQEMHHQVMAHYQDMDIIIGCAAVADFKFQEQSTQKLKKPQSDLPFELTFIKNPDIMKTLGHLSQRPFCVGFAAETEQKDKHGKEKLYAKKLDMIAVNDVSQPGVGFDADHNQLTVITPKSNIMIEKAYKHDVAHKLLDIIRDEYDAKNENKNS